nr:immunoglobulin heavy chain junction region [Mus musculus]
CARRAYSTNYAMDYW